MKESSLAEVAKVISQLESAVVVSHFNPDPDAFSSSSALGLILSQSGKKTAVVNQNGPDSRYLVIPGVGSVLREIPSGDWDAVITCDCADLERVGDKLVEAVRDSKLLINIDHHVSNSRFGDYNLVLGDKSSTAEIIYDLIAEMGIDISPKIANCILAGIMHDTGSFRYNSVTSCTFEAAGELLRRGADLQGVAAGIFGQRSVSSVKLQSEALANLKLHCDSRVSEVLVTEDMFKRHQAGFEDCEFLVEAARDIEGVVVAIFIRCDHGGKWKVSLRSMDERCNVSEIAAQFGGGGHKQAAAFRCLMELDQLRDRLLRGIAKELENI